MNRKDNGINLLKWDELSNVSCTFVVPNVHLMVSS